jgi:tetratricopeptide (TPR) repeat protein
MPNSGRPALRLLGAIECTGPDSQPASLADKQLALLIILIAAKSSGVARSELASKLWPDASPRASRHSLSQALYQIKKQLGREAITADASVVRLGGLSADVLQFRSALSKCDYERAALAYRGDLAFINADLPAEACHQIDAFRAGLRNSAESLLDEPISQIAREQLCEVFDIEAESVRGGSRTGCSYAFVGRRNEMAILMEVLRETQTAVTTKVAIVEGEPGVGKTALCSRFVRKAVLKGAYVLEARGSEVAANLAYGVVTQLVADAFDNSWLDELGHPWRGILGNIHPALHEPSPSDIGDLTLQTGLALRKALLFDIERTLVIFVDDVHWVDPASLAILHFLATAPIGRPLLLVVSRRTNCSRDYHAEWQSATLVPLQGLPPAELHYMAESGGETSPSPDDLRSLEVLTRGNPLLLHAILARGLPLESLPPTASQFYQQEIARLQPSEVLVGGALAAAGCRLDESLVAEIADLPKSVASQGLARLVALKYLDSISDSYGFTHGLIAEEFLVSLPTGRRAVLHARAGRLLQGKGLAPAVVADQFAIAGSAKEAFQTALIAAQASEKLHALSEAEHFYRIAVAHSGNCTDEATAQVGLAELLMRQGKPLEAVEFLRNVFNSNQFNSTSRDKLEIVHIIACSSTDQPPDALLSRLERLVERGHAVDRELLLRAHRAVAAAALDAGKFEVAMHCIGAGEHLLEGIRPSPSVVREEVKLKCLHGLLKRDEGGSYPLEDLLRRVEDNPPAKIDVLQAHAVVSLFNGRGPEAEKSLLAALAVSERFAVYHQYIALANNLAVCYLEQGRWSEAAGQFDVVLSSSQLSSRRELLSAYANYAVLKWETRQYEEASHAASRCLELGPVNESHRARVMGTTISGLVHLENGALSEARSAEHRLRGMLPIGRWWGNDNSYPEIFLSRMGVIGGRHVESIDRLSQQLNYSSRLDFYGAARIEIELLRHRGKDRPNATMERALALRLELQRARAVPLVERLDGIITRCRSAISD